MGKLICEDGTEVTISKETEENLRKQFGKKKKFEPITVAGTTIAIRDEEDSCPIVIQVKDYGSEFDRKEYRLDKRPYNFHCINYAKKIIIAIQSAIDYIENQ